MTREELVRRLQEAALTEEMAIPIYAQHLPKTLFWSRLPEKDIDFIKAGLSRLSADSSRHRAALELLAKTVSEAKRDVF